MIHLYLKISPKGKKYLGKTIKDPFKYMGSGKVWRRHITKHSYTKDDIDTYILYSDSDSKRFAYYAKKISLRLDIINDSMFCNITIEEGQGGTTWNCISEQGKRNFIESTKRPKSEEHKIKIGLSSNGRDGYGHKPVCQYTLEGDLIKVHKSISDALRYIGKNPRNASEIRDAINGGRYRKTRGKRKFVKRTKAFGYKWKDYVTK